jgi:hypothetical protein
MQTTDNISIKLISGLLASASVLSLLSISAAHATDYTFNTSIDLSLYPVEVNGIGV